MSCPLPSLESDELHLIPLLPCKLGSLRGHIQRQAHQLLRSPTSLAHSCRLDQRYCPPHIPETRYISLEI